MDKGRIPSCNLPHCNGPYAPLLASNHYMGKITWGYLLVPSIRGVRIDQWALARGGQVLWVMEESRRVKRACNRCLYYKYRDYHKSTLCRSWSLGQSWSRDPWSKNRSAKTEYSLFDELQSMILTIIGYRGRILVLSIELVTNLYDLCS